MVARTVGSSQRWLYAAAVYNLCWGCGAAVVAHPLGWKVVGMIVAVYAAGVLVGRALPGASRAPGRGRLRA